MEDRQTQHDGLKTSKVATLVSRAEKGPLEIELLCENLVPISTDPKEIQKSILRLKESMNFYYFAQLLNETGIPREMVFPFKEELGGMSRDYNDS
jgi:hypothetical protein